MAVHDRQCGIAAEAAQVCEQQKPDVVLLDMVMPEGGGVAAARRIAEKTPKTRSVMLTSFDGENQIRAALDAGVLSYVLKDIAAEALADVIRKARQDEPVLHPRAAAATPSTARTSPQWRQPDHPSGAPRAGRFAASGRPWEAVVPHCPAPR